MSAVELFKGDFPTPRLLRVPERRVSSCGQDLADVAESVGIPMDDHQRFVLDVAGSEYVTPRNQLWWAATQVGYAEPRQNGKSQLMLARTVGGILLLEEPRIIHSAHEVKTALESFRKLKDLCADYDVLSQRVLRSTNTNGREGLVFRVGPRGSGKTCDVSFMARTKKAGRGFSASTILLDEAQELADLVYAAIRPTLSAVPNSQVWLAGTPPSPEMHGDVFVRARMAAKAGTNPRQAWIEWGSGPDPENIEAYDYRDPANWLAANPAAPERILLETIEDECAEMDEETFRRDRLGEWDEDGGATVIPRLFWDRRSDPDVDLVDLVDPAIVFDVNESRSGSAISLAGYLDEERTRKHVKVLAIGPGTAWLGDALAGYVEKYPAVRAVLCDASSPAASLVGPLRQFHKIQVTLLQTRDVAMACGQMYDGFTQGTMTHHGQPELTNAMVGTVKREVGDTWVLARKKSEVDISGFVSATLALYGVSLKKVKRPRATRGRRKVSVA